MASPIRRNLFYAGAVIAALAVIYFIYHGLTHAETDDAYVTGHLHYISPRIAGVAQEVLVKDNQFVRAGDVLVKLDPADYQAQYNEAKANLDKARADMDRTETLVKVNATSREEVDHARSDFEVAQARLETAQLNLDYTQIKAPASGWVGRKNVEVGNRVQSGQALMVVVEEDMWVVANFKETQLAKMQIGQEAEITIDSIPGKTFLGFVDSFSPASGNEFALLPADNSTGNFTKIVQRIPVKIRFKPESIKDQADRIRAGMSVVVTIDLHRQQTAK